MKFQSAIFEAHEIRRVYDEATETWLFSVIDIIRVLTQQLDICGGHAGRGDDYHYHATPTCMIAQMPNAGPDAIIGWAFDGFPIYGDTNPDGSAIAPGDLDVCNGQPDPVYGFRYHTSKGAPYIIQCLRGQTAAMADLPRVPPLRASCVPCRPLVAVPAGARRWEGRKWPGRIRSGSGG